MGGGATLPVEEQAAVTVKLTAVLGLFSAVFNFSCGFCGLRGAKPGSERSLSAAAVKLGWLGLIAALVSAVFTLIGDVTRERVIRGSSTPSSQGTASQE